MNYAKLATNENTDIRPCAFHSAAKIAGGGIVFCDSGNYLARMMPFFFPWPANSDKLSTNEKLSIPGRVFHTGHGRAGFGNAFGDPHQARTRQQKGPTPGH
jgi:hypothetical protein